MARIEKQMNYMRIENIPLDSINAPEMLVRLYMGDQEDLINMGNNIKARGLINPITVKPNGARFDLVAGARRVMSSRLVGLAMIQAKIVDISNKEMALVRWSENNDRLQNSAYEESLFLQEMIENLKCSQVELSKEIGKSPAYVSQRLGVLNGFKLIAASLRDGVINFAQARELNLFPTEQSADRYCNVCIEGGSTPKLLRTWRVQEQNAFAESEKKEPTEDLTESIRNEMGLRLVMCECCRSTHFPQDVVYLRLCHGCETTIKKAGDTK